MALELRVTGHSKSEEQHRKGSCIAGRWMKEREFIVAAEAKVYLGGSLLFGRKESSYPVVTDP